MFFGRRGRSGAAALFFLPRPTILPITPTCTDSRHTRHSRHGCRHALHARRAFAAARRTRAGRELCCLAALEPPTCPSPPPPPLPAPPLPSRPPARSVRQSFVRVCLSIARPCLGGCAPSLLGRVRACAGKKSGTSSSARSQQKKRMCKSTKESFLFLFSGSRFLGGGGSASLFPSFFLSLSTLHSNHPQPSRLKHLRESADAVAWRARQSARRQQEEEEETRVPPPCLQAAAVRALRCRPWRENGARSLCSPHSRPAPLSLRGYSVPADSIT